MRKKTGVHEDQDHKFPPEIFDPIRHVERSKGHQTHSHLTTERRKAQGRNLEKRNPGSLAYRQCWWIYPRCGSLHEQRGVGHEGVEAKVWLLKEEMSQKRWTVRRQTYRQCWWIYPRCGSMHEQMGVGHEGVEAEVWLLKEEMSQKMQPSWWTVRETNLLRYGCRKVAL